MCLRWGVASVLGVSCKGCCKIIDDYMFDFNEVAKVIKTRKPRAVVLEAPQGMVRLLERLAEFLAEECLVGEDIEVYIRLEPSFGSCSVSFDVLDTMGSDIILVHIGHGEYSYPLCRRGACVYGIPDNIYLVEGEYLGGDAGALANKVIKVFEANGWSSTAIGYSIQHKRLANTVANLLSESGISVIATDNVIGCNYYSLAKLRDRVDAYLVVAGGYFHALGLGLALSGSTPVLRIDPYTSCVEDIARLAAKTLAKRYWLMQQAVNASKIGIVVGLLAGQYRPWIAEYLARLADKRGVRYRFILARYVTREYLDNLSPDDYDAYVMVSCPRLAIEDFSDYWKPVLTPAEARIVLSGGIAGQQYTFPW